MEIKLRAIEPSDIDLIYTWENDTEVWDTSNTLIPFSRYMLEQYILSAQSLDIYASKQLRLMIDVNEDENVTTVGIIDLFDFDPTHQRAGVGILIEPYSRHKGYASAALQELIHYSFSILQLHQLYCNIMLSNKVSLTLFQTAGFEIAGVKKEWLKLNGIWEDEYMLQLIKK